jgi:cyclohexadienyl dehydratase
MSAPLRTLLCLVLVLAAPLPRAAEDDALASPEVRRLLDRIEHRARLMPAVARWKWHAQRPVTDPAREAAVLEAAAAEARAAGLEAAGAIAFVDAQMAVARDVQEARFAAWRAGDPPPPDGPELVTELRPAIGAVTAAILAELPAVLPLLADAEAPLAAALGERLHPLGAGPESTAALARALASLRPATIPPPGLDAVRERGELRVGTTGDYAPFSVGEGETLAGIDVDLARNLAEALGVSVRFVPTSWPTLLDDLLAGRFDLALSGVSRTLARARVADFSEPYHVGGKTPIVRCTDRARFTSLEAIDRPGVRAIVNPGGTNEAFARERLAQAELRVFPDNRRVFTEIAEGRADVMFTDAIEVRLQSALDPRLCPALPGRTLTYAEKGVLLRRDADGALLRFVNLWLAQRRGDGTLERVFAKHLAPPAE